MTVISSLTVHNAGVAYACGCQSVIAELTRHNATSRMLHASAFTRVINTGLSHGPDNTVRQKRWHVVKSPLPSVCLSAAHIIT